MMIQKCRTALRAAIIVTSAAIALAVGIGGTLLPNSAEAMPIALADRTAVESNVTLARDGCGRGMRFSNSRQACVEDFQGGPQVAPGECPRGMRFSNNRGGCVPVGGVDPGAAIINGVINGVVNGNRGDGCGRGMRFSNRLGQCVPL
jgi:hypothetical protein